MDEPCSALDPIATARVEELIDELKSKYTIVVVTHNMHQAARISQRTAFFHLGKLIEFDETDKIFTSPSEQKLLMIILLVDTIIKEKNMIEIHDHISSSFNNELSVLDDSLIEMGSNLEKMFEETLLAINEKDEALAKVISSDKNIDELEISVISQIQTLIAKRQPVGVDLRVLVGCTRIAGYMERIGDLLSSICKRVVILIEHSVEKEKEELIKLSTAVNNLFKLSLNAFAKKISSLQKKLNEDIDIDKLYKGFFNSLLEKMSKDSKLAVPGTHMLFISKILNVLVIMPLT